MIQNAVSAIGGVAALGIISISLFFVVFGAMLIWAFCLKKNFLKSMGAMALENPENPQTGEGEDRHE
jgi:hypothetical protein